MAAKTAEPADTADVKPHRTAAGSAVWRVLSVGSTLIATKVATDVAQRSWKIVTGRHVPVKGDYERERTRDILLFTALSSALVSSARVAAERGAVAYYRKSTGNFPRRVGDEELTPKDIKAHRKLTRKKTRNEYRVQKAINRAGRRK